MEALLAFDQRAVDQILAVTVQQVEGDKARLSAAEQEFVELGLPIAVETHDLAVEDDRFSSVARDSLSVRKDLNSFPLRETSLQRPCSM